MLKLRLQIVAEKLRARDAARIGARLGNSGEGARRLRGGFLSAIGNPKLGVGEGSLLARFGIGHFSVPAVSGKRLPKACDGLVVDGAELIED